MDVLAGFSFELTCPYDGEPVRLCASGTTNGWSTRAVCRCTACHVELIVQCQVAAPNGWNRSRATPAKMAQLAQARARLAEKVRA